jgi:hypothetical protein
MNGSKKMDNVTELVFKDEDGGENIVLELRIRPVDNGWVLSIEGDDEDLEEVYTAKSGLLARIEELV